MKKFNYLYFLFVIFVSLFLSSCDKEEDIVDLRDDIVGTYNYNVKFYETQQGIGYLRDDDISGVMIATKSGNDRVIFKVGNEVIFTINKLKARTGRLATQNGITFDLVSETDYIKGQNVKVVGDHRIDFNGIKYQGAYYSSLGKLKVSQKVSYLIDRFPVTVVAMVEATKQ